MAAIAPSHTKTYNTVKREIENWVNLNSVGIIWERWYCGITNNPKIRKTQHKVRIKSKPYFFKAWHAKSLTIASSLETSFHKKGMRNKDLLGNAKANSWFIYVFKEYPTILDELMS